jgi:hypothetical protein
MVELGTAASSTEQGIERRLRRGIPRELAAADGFSRCALGHIICISHMRIKMQEMICILDVLEAL